jgi:hypothetical protein
MVLSLRALFWFVAATTLAWVCLGCKKDDDPYTLIAPDTIEPFCPSREYVLRDGEHCIETVNKTELDQTCCYR